MKSFVSIVLTVLAMAASPSRASAQLVDVTDPCYATLFPGSTTNVLATGSWNNRSHLEEGALILRSRVEQLLSAVRKAQKDGTAATLTPAELELLRAFNRCLPWLGRQLNLIVTQMKRLGQDSIVSPGRRQPVPVDPFVKEVEDALKEAERLLAQILKVR